MSAVVDTDFLRLAHKLSCSPTDRLGAFRRIVAKLETGFLDADDLNAVVERIRAGAVTFDEGLAVLATAH